MSGFFQRLFGKDNKPAIARGPLGLHLNSGFTLDTLAFRLLEDELLIALPGEEFTVAAVSRIDLGGGAQMLKYASPPMAQAWCQVMLDTRGGVRLSEQIQNDLLLRATGGVCV